MGVSPPQHDSPGQGREQVARRLPLELKLPMLMTAILATVLTIAVIATYVSLRSAALARAVDRADRATRQIATVAAASLPPLNLRYRAVVNDSAIHRALRGERVNVEPLLARLSQPADSGMPVELWTRDGHRVAFVGDDIRGSGLAVQPGRPELPTHIARTVEMNADRVTDSLRLGPLYEDKGRVHFWLIMPVREGNRVLGYVTHQRRIQQNAQTTETLRELSGDSASMYYRNIDGSYWATVGGSATPALPTPNARGVSILPTGERLLVQEERVGATPLVVGMSIPEGAVVARATRPVRNIALLSVLLVLSGGFAAWLIGRSVARPLGRITNAAEMLATGDFDTRVPVSGEHEVRRLAASFNHMAAELARSRQELQQQTMEAKAANNAKSDFLTTMSHELRTPLNAIGGYVDLLDMELRGPLTAAQRRDLERIKASQQHLLGLISGVLDLARVEAGKVSYDLSNVPVDSFLAGIDALIEPQAKAKGVALTYVPADADLAVIADREKLRQILLNLLSNAVKHTPQGGTVTLSADGLGGRVQIVVEDTGPGIPDDKREEIFEPFVQLDRSLSQPGEGLGLGLSISRDLARGMSGELTVDRHVGNGARFVLTLNRGSIDPNSTPAFTGEAPIVRKVSH